MLPLLESRPVSIKGMPHTLRFPHLAQPAIFDPTNINPATKVNTAWVESKINTQMSKKAKMFPRLKIKSVDRDKNKLQSI